mmetsp:Transcript_17392/g.40618  ORF Transcript_17392/g.40618 Transcript_17392/m.40618 type:complete len:200 (+) Transcript_17392:113-712(+)
MPFSFRRTLGASSASVLFSCLAASGWRSAGANSMYLANLCRDRWCSDLDYPLLDYEDGECLCKPHPCWNLNGVKHTCQEPDFPFLHYMVAEDGNMKCLCSSVPHYDSPHLVMKMCPSRQCDTEEHPILDLHFSSGGGLADASECICRSHPCHNANGQKHKCDSPEFPILRYRQDPEGEPVCDCVARLEEPVSTAQQGEA